MYISPPWRLITLEMYRPSMYLLCISELSTEVRGLLLEILPSFNFENKYTFTRNSVFHVEDGNLASCLVLGPLATHLDPREVGLRQGRAEATHVKLYCRHGRYSRYTKATECPFLGTLEHSTLLEGRGRRQYDTLERACYTKYMGFTGTGGTEFKPQLSETGY